MPLLKISDDFAATFSPPPLRLTQASVVIISRPAMLVEQGWWVGEAEGRRGKRRGGRKLAERAMGVGGGIWYCWRDMILTGCGSRGNRSLHDVDVVTEGS